MTEEERRKRAAIRRRKKKKARQRRIMIGSAIGLILILLLVVGAVKMSKKKAAATPGNSVESAIDGENPAVNDETSGEESKAENEAEPEMKWLDLSAYDTHVGDLILVNSSLPYDFDANAPSAQIVNIRETQSFYYQVHKLELSVDKRIMAPLDKLIKACHDAMGNEEAGVESAYRSIDYQQNVWDQMAADYGDDYAEKYVAVPGYSEHHTGLSIDIGLFYPDGTEGSFSESQSAVWMNDNSWRFGFVRRYAADKVEVTGISNEAWHFRYVGVPHAKFMKENNLALEEYIDYLRTKTNMSQPLTVETEDGTYGIFITKETKVPAPAGDYTVSGSNSGEWIVTEKLS